MFYIKYIIHLNNIKLKSFFIQSSNEQCKTYMRIAHARKLQVALYNRMKTKFFNAEATIITLLYLIAFPTHKY